MMNSSAKLLAALLCCVAVAASAAQPGKKAAPATAPVPPPPPQPLVIEPAAIDQALKGMVDSQKIVGVSALVYQGGKEVYFGAFGMADRENDKPMARDTVVQIFSMTKPITGVAFMMLYERGKFQLDDPLDAYAPEFADQQVFAGVDDAGQPKYEALKRKITIRDVLRHTAGFVNEDDKDPVGEILRQTNPRAYTNSLQVFEQKFATVPLVYQPGTRWRYSYAVDLQAYLTQKISGVPFDKFLELHLFKPLGMNSTRFTILPSDADRAKLAAVYIRNDDGSFTRQPDEEAYKFNGQDWPLKPGNFGLVSTIDDYMKFARMLLAGGKLGRARILKPETVQLMATDAVPKDVSDKMWLPSKGQMGFGIDFAVRVAPPKDANEASGAVGEFFWDGKLSTLFWVDPKNDIAAVLFTQMFPFDRVHLHKAFRDAVYRNDPVALAH
jgi:CubicO group peptidase (beta-lactamase class C family)